MILGPFWTDEIQISNSKNCDFDIDAAFDYDPDNSTFVSKLFRGNMRHVLLPIAKGYYEMVAQLGPCDELPIEIDTIM